MNEATRVLLIDNYDSFTHNLYQQIAVHHVTAKVVRNDSWTLSDLFQWRPSHIVLSPGPGHPANARDFGICGDVIDEVASRGVPVLGVCLGHQGIVHRFGGHIERAPEVVHGKTAHVRHDGSGPFAGLARRVEVMRYHSLVAVERDFPSCLKVTARLDEPGKEALIMAVEHREMPLWGVQFHPESIGTPDGDIMVANFLRQPSSQVPKS